MSVSDDWIDSVNEPSWATVTDGVETSAVRFSTKTRAPAGRAPGWPTTAAMPLAPPAPGSTRKTLSRWKLDGSTIVWVVKLTVAVAGRALP